MPACLTEEAAKKFGGSRRSCNAACKGEDRHKSPPSRVTVIECQLSFLELKEFYRRPVLDNKGNGDAIRWRVRWNNYLLTRNLCREVIYLKGDVRNGADNIGYGCVRFEAHPFDSVGARVVTRHVGCVSLNQSLTLATLCGGDSNMVVSAHGNAFYPTRPGLTGNCVKSFSPVTAAQGGGTREL